MNKFTFTVEIVGEGCDCQQVVDRIDSVVRGVGKFRCCEHTDTKPLSEQGLKVWTKRKVGVSLATPKPAKTPKAEVSENVEVVA